MTPTTLAQNLFSKTHQAWLRIAGVVFMLAFSSTGHAQTSVPDTFTLKPGFVGAQSEIPLTRLLPTGASVTTWQLSPAVAHSLVTLGDGTQLERPHGVMLANVVDGAGIKIGEKLVVAPTSADYRKDPYVFDLIGTDAIGNHLTIRFRLPIKPFGIDESKVKSLSNAIAGFTPAHDEAVPAAPNPPFILTTSTADEETVVLDQELAKADPPVTGPDFSDENLTRVSQLINDTVGREKQVTEQVLITGGQKPIQSTKFQAGDYLLTHIIVWKPSSEKGDARRELWGLFKAEDDESDKQKVAWIPQGDPTNKNVFSSRIFGGKRVAVLLIHFNTPPSWDVKYTVALNQRIPTPIQNLLTLAQGIAGGGAPQEKTNEEPKTIWGARMMLVRYSASDMLVKVNTITAGDAPVEQTKDYSKKYLNEGRYHWDVSIGLPIKSVKELQYKSEGGQVTTAAKERQSAYGFFNFFPKKVDLSSEPFLTVPHLVFGVPLATKPLHHPFVGIGYGVYKTPVKFNLFAGIVFNRERVPRTLGAGDAANSSQLEADLKTRWVRKFMFGINFPVSQIKDALKK